MSTMPQVPRRGNARTKINQAVALTTVSDDQSRNDVSQNEANRNQASQDDIARLAYSLWEARRGIGGSAEEDWYQAEQEIRSRS